MMTNIADVHNMHKELEGGLARKMAEFEERLKTAMIPTSPTLNQLRDEFYSFKGIVSSMLSLMQQQISDCVKNIDAINTHHRKKALIFNGIPESNKDDLQQEVLSLLHGKMGLTSINSSSLKQCFRLGVQQSNRPRPVVVFFYDHQCKVQVWNMKSKLKGSTISLGEFLTKVRQSIYKCARKHFGMRNVWSLDGVIYIKHPEGRGKICTHEELDALMAKFPSTGTTMDRTPDSCDVVKAIQTPGTSNSLKTTETRCASSISGQLGKVRRQQLMKTQDDDSKRAKRLASKK